MASHYLMETPANCTWLKFWKYGFYCVKNRARAATERSRWLVHTEPLHVCPCSCVDWRDAPLTRTL